MSKNTAKKIAIGTLIAAAAGYVAGILTAPKSGRETRQTIKTTTAQSIAEAEKELKKLHTQLGEASEAVRKQTASLSGKAKKDVDAALGAAKKAKEKARILLSTIHDHGNAGADDQDLQKAIAEAQKAADHLKAFLTK